MTPGLQTSTKRRRARPKPQELRIDAGSLEHVMRTVWPGLHAGANKYRTAAGQYHVLYRLFGATLADPTSLRAKRAYDIVHRLWERAIDRGRA